MEETIIETKSCKQCGTSFEITDADLVFYEKVSPVYAGKKYSISPPTLCPDCRQQRRMSWRNERKLYRRTCDLTGKPIVSIYHPETKFPVYSAEARFGDAWEGLDHGQDYDFTKPFFQQYFELQQKVPRIAMICDNNQNCDYTNGVSDSKNCYLIYGGTLCEDCMYGSPYTCKNCVDSFLLRDSEYCYECTDCSGLYNCSYCRNCAKSSELQHCLGVEGSADCFGCVGLITKKYCIFNVQYSKEDYLTQLQDLKAMTKEAIQEKMNALLAQMPFRYYIGTGNEQVEGNYIFNSNKCSHTFDVSESENCRHSTYLTMTKTIMDCDYGERGELLYENCGFRRLQKVAFGYMNRIMTDNLWYCSLCYNNVHNCFGCIGIKNKQYCILNKQYTQEEYEALMPKIIAHMTANGERGEFFPIASSCYGYNETCAQDYYPLTREQALAKGYAWLDKEYPINIPANAQTIPASEIPQDITQVDDRILEQVLLCEVTGKPYRITKSELDFYHKHHLPLPKRHPDQRHLERMALRNSRKLRDRPCSKCGATLKTTYAPSRPEKVYCEACYNHKIY